MTIQMVERVARVISEGLGENPDAPHLTLGETELRAWQQHETLARAAIEATKYDNHKVRQKMNLDLSTAAGEFLAAKDAERDAVERRRLLENHMLSLIGVAENMEGTENVETDGGYKIKITGRMTRKVNGERIQEIAAEEGLTDHLQSLFRWKPEINMTAWKSADKSITGPLLGGITTQPGRASFIITKD